MNFIGWLNWTSPGAGGTQPHAQVFQGNKMLYIVTFDDTTYPVSGGDAFSWGKVCLYAAQNN
jgi:hypothetical protein